MAALWPSCGRLLVITRMHKGRFVASLALSYNVASLASSYNVAVTYKGRIKDTLWPPRGRLRTHKGRFVASLALSYNVASLALSYNVASLALVTMLHRWP